MKHKMNRIVSFILLTMVLVFLLSCGGSREEDVGGIGGTGYVEGPITGFGSIFVNGIRIEIDEADILLNSTEGLQSDLELGMIVKIRATIDQENNTAIATSVEFENNLEGPIGSIDPTFKSISVLGQTINIDALTEFKGKTIEDLLVGNIVMVSGFKSGSSSLTATLIKFEKETFVSGEDEQELKGVVHELDTDLKIFQIGELVISYSNSEFNDFNEIDLAEGFEVAVVSKESSSGNILMAESIKLLDRKIQAEEGSEIKLTGIVDLITSNDEFKINGTTVLISDLTKFENGSIESLQLDARLEIEGALNADGAIVSKEIVFIKESRVEVKALLEKINTETKSIKLLGFTIQYTTSTVIRGHGESEEGTFSAIDSFATGDLVIIKGFINEDNQIVATEIEYKESLSTSDDDVVEVYVEGPVKLGNDQVVFIGNAEFSITQEIEIDGKENAEVFFNEINFGEIIRITGKYVNEKFVSSVIKIED